MKDFISNTKVQQEGIHLICSFKYKGLFTYAILCVNKLSLKNELNFVEQCSFPRSLNEFIIAEVCWYTLFPRNNNKVKNDYLKNQNFDFLISKFII